MSDLDTSSILEELHREREERTQALGFDLLPCPFCGGAPFVDYSEEFDMEYVSCECGAAFSGNDPAGWNSRVNVEPKRTN